MSTKLKKDFWDLTNRPYTKLKLRIFGDYLAAWLSIIAKQAGLHPEWKSWNTIYFIDCCAGRGKYNNEGKENCIKGSPLIAMDLFESYSLSYPKLECIFVEEKPNVRKKLNEFINEGEYKNQYELISGNFNDNIDYILSKIKNNPAFFFVDPNGIDLKKESIEKIVQRKGPTDVIINYIKGGVERISGLAKKEVENIPAKEMGKYLKTVTRLTDFFGTSIFENIDESERKKLQEWGKSIFNSGSSSVQEVAVFSMPQRDKIGNIYYLIFGSKKTIAKKIILDIFKKHSKTTYRGQMLLPLGDEKKFEL